jgi:PAS domain S-box-containing protein
MIEERKDRFSPALMFNRHRWAVILLMFVLAAGTASTWWVARLEDREMRQGLLADARLVAHAIDLQHVQNLSGSDADLNSPDYQRLKEQLILLGSAKARCRFLYLMGQRQDGAVFFFVDSELPDSNDYSPPGQVYEEASDDLRRAFATGRQFVEGPVSDHWGTWVSALVPITDPRTGRLLAIFGADIDASDWGKQIAIRCAAPILIAFSFAALLTSFFMIQRLTERKRAEQRLRESEQRYKTLFEANADGILIADVATKQFRYANPAICRMLGYSEDELVRLSISDIHPKESLERVTAEFEALISGAKVLADDLPCVRKDGQIISVSISAGAVTIDQTKYLMGVFRDITDRKLAEETQSHLLTILETTPDFVGFADPKNAGILYINSAGRQMVGIGADEDVTRLKINDVHPEWANQLLRDEIIPTAIRDGTWKGECAFLNRDGHEIPVMMVLMAHKSASGKVDRISTISRDITERKRMEDVLLANEAKYRLLTESLPQKVFLKDRDSVYLSCNNNYARDLKIKAEEIKGKTDYDFYPKDLAEKYRADDKRIMEQGVVEDIEEKYLQEGQEVFVQTVKAPVRNEQGNVFGVLGVFWDITKRKQAEEEASNLRRQIEFILGATKTGLDIIDSQLNVCYVDPEWAKVYGDWKGRKCYEYFMGRDSPCPACGIPEALRTKQVTVTEELLVKEGNRPIQVTTIPYQNKHGEWLVAEVSVDITERKRMEESLRQTNAYLESLLDYANAPIIVWDPQLRITRFNHAFESLTGRNAVDVIGKSIDILFPPQFVGMSMELLKKTLEGERMETVEIDILHLDGSIRTLLWNSATIFADDGKTPIAAVAQGHNITERKKAEQMVAETNDKLGEVNKHLQEFTYIVSHDLREPTRKITAFGQLLGESLRGKLNDDDKENLQYMIDGADRMQKVVEAVLEYSRVTTKGDAFEAVDLNEIVEQLKGFELAVSIEETGAVVLAPEPLPSVKADPPQVRQLLQNLIANAIKYRRKDVAPEIIVHAKSEEDTMVRVEVQDNGIGIKREQIRNLFVMFRRLHQPGEYEGTGIGLAVCKRIIERHGGRIGAESVYGEGSTFWFTLPAVSTAKDQPEPALSACGSAEHS